MNYADKRLLSGYLVGIGKVRADGSQEYHKIPPVKNMIVKQGLNNWLRYNGNNSTKFDMTNVSQKSILATLPAANIDYCAYGTGNTPNDFVNTTELTARSVSPYNTKKQYWPYCGSTNYDNAGNFKLRCSHLSPAASSATSVKEIGFYTHYTNGTNILFSRVVLPFTYNLEAGEQLLTTYELIVNFPYSATIAGPLDVSLHDANGVQLKAQAKQVMRLAMSGYTQYSLCSPVQPNGTFEGGMSYGYMWPPIAYNVPYQYDMNILYWTSSKNFPGYNSAEPTSGMNYDQDYSRPIITCGDYTEDSFHRDVTINCPTFWPRMSNSTAYTDIYYINFMGFALRFGHVVDGVFTPTPWRKYADKTARFVYRQAVATAESIAWQQST